MEEMTGNYPELKRAEALIKETLKMEEEKFLVLLDRGMKILNEEITKIDKVLPGDIAFKLYDTYGFPLDLTEDILKNKSLKIDNKKFNELMKQSRELAKKNWKGSGDSAVDDIWFGIKDKLGPTEFLGYETNQAEGVVQTLLKNNKEVKSLKVNDEGIAHRIMLEEKLDEAAALAWQYLGEERSARFVELLDSVGDVLMGRIDETAGKKWMPAGR